MERCAAGPSAFDACIPRSRDIDVHRRSPACTIARPRPRLNHCEDSMMCLPSVVPSSIGALHGVLKRPALGLFALCLALSSCEEKKAVAGPPPPPDVEVVEVVEKDVPIYREWVGTTIGDKTAEIRGQASGYLTKQIYRDGSVVKSGDALFEIDARPLEASLMQAKGQLEQAKGQLALAKTQVDQQKAQLAKAEADAQRTQIEVTRLTPLAKDGAVSQQEVDNAVQNNAANNALVTAGKATIRAAESNVTAQEANVAAAQAFEEQAKVNLGFTKITAPIDGVAGIAQAQIGDLVGPQTGIVLTTISTIDPIKVTFPISEQEYMRAADRFAEIEKHPSEEILDLVMTDGTTYAQKGRISVADRQVDPRTGTITVQGIFKNPNRLLRPGQFARVRAQVRTNKGALLVPQRCVTELQGQYQIAIVGGDNKVEVRNVKVGERIGSMWIVEEGLKPKEHVVFEGVQKARGGTVVKPILVADEREAKDAIEKESKLPGEHAAPRDPTQTGEERKKADSHAKPEEQKKPDAHAKPDERKKSDAEKPPPSKPGEQKKSDEQNKPEDSKKPGGDADAAKEPKNLEAA
jgi:membrane fusion protein (multidrug efflux system)